MRRPRSAFLGEGTDLTISLDGRNGEVDDGRKNMPGESSSSRRSRTRLRGVITFSEYPAVYDGRELEGIRLEFADGKVVSASAARGEHILQGILDRDEGAQRIGELGIGSTPASRAT